MRLYGGDMHSLIHGVVFLQFTVLDVLVTHLSQALRLLDLHPIAICVPMQLLLPIARQRSVTPMSPLARQRSVTFGAPQPHHGSTLPDADIAAHASHQQAMQAELTQSLQKLEGMIATLAIDLHQTSSKVRSFPSFP